MRKLALMLLLMVSTSANATVVVGKVKDIKVFEIDNVNGTFVYMDELPAACGLSNGHKRFVIKGDHPSHDPVLSIVIAAKMSGSDIRVNYKETCNDNSISWDLFDVTLK
ncbi:hypothetical protein [Hahella ganghwensis]|uniref:hypothetical protein n=1 Tax=Hahella ganghwensis TaxID=286420 RepID=UPI0003A0CD5A|nr:hypothetical protein [Hahella ganghwensis]